MIAEICFTADWLEKKRRELRGVDPSLLERALHAFALLGHLAESDRFDVGELFNLADDLTAVRRVYQRVFDLENVYRGGGFTVNYATFRCGMNWNLMLNSR